MNLNYYLAYFVLPSFRQMAALHLAVERAHTEVVKCLIDRGADISIKDYNGVNIHYIHMTPIVNIHDLTIFWTICVQDSIN